MSSNSHLSKRRRSVPVKVGGVEIGGDAPIVVQSMTNTDTADVSLRHGLGEEAAPLEARDHQRWPTLGVELWPNWYVGETWDDELGFMRTWTLERAAWMDAALPGLCAR